MRIAIHAASLNFPDLLTVQNKYQVKPPLPFVPGSEFSGVDSRLPMSALAEAYQRMGSRQVRGKLLLLN